MATGKTHCAVCSKERCTLRCGGCLKEFCFNHLAEHRQELTKQLDNIEVNRDLFRESLTKNTNEPKNNPLIQQINKWEHDSIEKIQKTAEEAKQLLINHTTECFNQIEIKLNKLTDQLREIRQENDFNEINLLQLQEGLGRLSTELTKPLDISIRQDSSSFINKIYVDVSKCEATSIAGLTVAHASVAENVAVKSFTSMENTQKMAALMRKLGTTHQQIDEYSRRHTQQTSGEVAAAISRIVADTQVQQQRLLADANVRSVSIEEEYKFRLQRYIEELDTVKAANLATLEKDLNLRQEMILEEARKRIDDSNEEANRLKLAVLREAQAQNNARIEGITEEVAALLAASVNHFAIDNDNNDLTRTSDWRWNAKK